MSASRTAEKKALLALATEAVKFGRVYDLFGGENDDAGALTAAAIAYYRTVKPSAPEAGVKRDD